MANFFEKTKVKKGCVPKYLDIDCIHFSRLGGTTSENPVEFGNYAKEKYINNRRDYAIKPRACVYLIPCDEKNPGHHFGDGLCEFLSSIQETEKRKVNAILFENSSKTETYIINHGDTLEEAMLCPYGTYRRLEIPEMLVESRLLY